MLIDFKIRALFIWTDPYLPDLICISADYLILLETLIRFYSSPRVLGFAQSLTENIWKNSSEHLSSLSHSNPTS